MKGSYPLNINDLTINSENSLKLLCIELDNKLSFTLCNKASNQLHAIGSIQKFMGFKEKEVLLSSFVYSKSSEFTAHGGKGSSWCLALFILQLTCCSLKFMVVASVIKIIHGLCARYWRIMRWQAAIIWRVTRNIELNFRPWRKHQKSDIQYFLSE